MTQRHPEDLPWNDVADDGDTLAVNPEPDPAEVVEDEDDDPVADAASPRIPDPYEKYRQESLDERLEEEEPDAALRDDADDDDGVQLLTSEGGDDVLDSGPDAVDLGEENVDDMDAEEAAIHLRDRP